MDPVALSNMTPGEVAHLMVDLQNDQEFDELRAVAAFIRGRDANSLIRDLVYVVSLLTGAEPGVGTS